MVCFKMRGEKMFYKSLLKPILFQYDAERAHNAACKAAKKTAQSNMLSSLFDALYNFQSPLLSQNFFGHTFRNPIGLAAGFDKNGCLIEAMETLGMGFVEVGSITARASSGNPKPRAFRLPKDRALINRMGLNNDGAQTVIKRLQNAEYDIPAGINIAKTHDPGVMGDEAIRDYLFSYKEAQKIADYITINISCPNTTEGKTFEDPAVLEELLSALLKEKTENMVPTLVKFSPDLNQPTLEELVEVCEKHQIDGYVACNTSSDRTSLKTDLQRVNKIGAGGLSGSPLSSKSIRTVKWIRAIATRKPIIGVGGIDSFEAAFEMMKAGANLLQIYTGLVYEGPALVKRINRQLVHYLQAHEMNSLKEL